MRSSAWERRTRHFLMGAEPNRFPTTLAQIACRRFPAAGGGKQAQQAAPAPQTTSRENAAWHRGHSERGGGQAGETRTHTQHQTAFYFVRMVFRKILTVWNQDAIVASVLVCFMWWSTQAPADISSPSPHWGVESWILNAPVCCSTTWPCLSSSLLMTCYAHDVPNVLELPELLLSFRYFAMVTPPRLGVWGNWRCLCASRGHSGRAVVPITAILVMDHVPHFAHTKLLRKTAI